MHEQLKIPFVGIENIKSLAATKPIHHLFLIIFLYAYFQHELLLNSFNKKYLTELPLHAVIIFSHHFMFAYSFLARII